MEVRLQACEEKVKDRALTHGHLNKLGKISKQLKGIATKLTAMDENWQTFSKKVQQKYEQHRNMYHRSRQELVQAYMTKTQELEMAKQEIQQASHQLSQQVSLVQPPIMTPGEDTNEHILEAMQQDAMLTAAEMDGMYPNPAQFQDMEGVQEIFDDAPDPQGEVKAQPKKDALKPFSRAVASSPTKVANFHLKPKDNDKEKAKSSKPTS